MGSFGFLWFGEKDIILCQEIARAHKLDLAKVKEEYKKMIEKLEKEKQGE